MCCTLYMQGWVILTNALPGFSISHAVLDGYEWVDGNCRTSLVMPGRSPSAKRVNWVIHSEASSWQCLWKCQRYTPFLYSSTVVFFSSVSFYACRVFCVLNLSTWVEFYPFPSFPLHFPVFLFLTLSLFILASEIIYIGPVKGKLSPSSVLSFQHCFLSIASLFLSTPHSWCVKVTWHL